MPDLTLITTLIEVVTYDMAMALLFVAFGIFQVLKFVLPAVAIGVPLLSTQGSNAGCLGRILFGLTTYAAWFWTSVGLLLGAAESLRASPGGGITAVGWTVFFVTMLVALAAVTLLLVYVLLCNHASPPSQNTSNDSGATTNSQRPAITRAEPSYLRLQCKYRPGRCEPTTQQALRYQRQVPPRTLRMPRHHKRRK